jgi:hypothetical protein
LLQLALFEQKPDASQTGPSRRQRQCCQILLQDYVIIHIIRDCGAALEQTKNKSLRFYAGHGIVMEVREPRLNRPLSFSIPFPASIVFAASPDA